MPVLLPEHHRVVAISGDQGSLCAVGRHGLALQKRCLGQVGLPKAGLVQLLEVNYPPWLAGLPCANVHGLAP